MQGALTALKAPQAERTEQVDTHQQLAALAERLDDWEGKLPTEEATKHALVLPFLQALGYNVFDPSQVIPEFVADVAGLRGEKVDYALIHNDEPVILIECKKAGSELNESHLSQLVRYFGATQARIGILTNGIVYQFFTDLEQPNIMDKSPFLILDLRILDENNVNALERITTESFDLEGMLSAALELAYLRGMRKALERQLHDPDQEVVAWLARQVYTGQLRQSVREEFTERTRRAFRSLINDKVNEVIRRAADLQEEAPENAVSAASATDSHDEDASDANASDEHEAGIATTAEEIEAYEIIKAILEDTVEPNRVFMRDHQQYCAILLDDNNRQTLCRFRFGPRRKSVGLFDADRKESRHTLESLDHIYQHADQLCATAKRYDEQKA